MNARATLNGRSAIVWMWSILAAILAHALIPHGEALARTRGSAFSATTADVLVLRAAAAPEQLRPRPDDPPPPPPPAAALAAATLSIPAAVPATVAPAAWPVERRLARPGVPRLLGPPGHAPPVSRA